MRMLRGYGKYILIAISYFALARMGLLLATINNSASPVWPATGFAFFAMYIFGRRKGATIAAIACGAFAANLFTGAPLLAVLAITVGNTLEAFAGSYILERILRHDGRFENQDETAGAVASSVLATMISATIGVISLIFTGAATWSQFLSIWTTWWIGDMLGGLVIAPTLITFWKETWRPKGKIEFGVVSFFLPIAAIILISAFVFFHPRGSAFLFLVFPVLLISVSAFGNLGSRITMLGISVLAILLTVEGYGPFVNGILNDNLINLQLFLASVGVTAMMLNGFKKSGSLKIPAMVLMLGWLLSGSLFFSFHTNERIHDEVRFRDMVSDTQISIENRMKAYEDALLGGVGLFQASQDVSLAEWKSYLSTVKVEDRYPGINGVGVIWPVKTKDLAKFKELVRQRGVDDFNIHAVPGSLHEFTEKDRGDERHIITYIEPLEGNVQARGLDIASEDARRTAANIARDTGRPTITAKVSLVQDSEARPGFLLFYPFYKKGSPVDSVEARQKAFLGWVYAPFITQNFFNGILGKHSAQIHFYAFEGSTIRPEALLFRSDENSSTLPAMDWPKFDAKTSLTWGQQQFTLAWKRSSGFVSSHDTTAAWVGLCGAIVSLLLAGLVVSLESVNRRAKLLADRKTTLLSESEGRFRSVAQSARDAIISADSAGRIISWNAAAERMFGHSEQEVVAQKLSIIMPERFREAHEKGLARVASQQSIVESKVIGSTVELIGLHQDGSEFPIELSISCWDSNEGRFFSGIIRDISERKQSENKLRAAHEEALSATKMKSEFLATMSHEIRTPINGVIGMTGLLLDTALSKEQRDYANNIKRSGEALLTVINDILDFSKIEAGKLDFEAVDFDLWEAVEDCRKTLEFSAAKKLLLLHSDLSPDLPHYVKGDIGRFKQVLINLLSNAIKFTSKGRVCIRGKLLTLENSKARMRFEVEDTGIGVAPDAIDRMFKAFSQADSSTQRKYGGTGLGLSICKKLVEQMGGEIGVISEINRGSNFWFEVVLPLGNPVVAQDDIDLSSLKNLEVDRKPRILIAEDNTVNQVITRKMIEKMGFYADVVANGHEVLVALGVAPYDLILMDCQMPEMDGYEATRQIRSSRTLKHPEIPILAMTANAMAGDAEKCLAAGMDDYISKPISYDKLAQVIRNWLDSDRKLAV